MSSDRTRKAILAAYQRNEESVTVEGLAREAGVTVSAVYYHLTNLRRVGLVTRARIPLGKSSPRKAKAKDAVDGRKSRGMREPKHVYVPRPDEEKSKSKTKAELMEERIKAIVKAAKLAESAAGVDVVYDFRRSFSARVRATKLG